MNKGAHLARLFLSDERQWVEVFNFAGEFGWELLGVGCIVLVGATRPVDQSSPRVFDSVAHSCVDAEACNHDASCQIKAPLIIEDCRLPIAHWFFGFSD